MNLRVMAANLNGQMQSYQSYALRIFQGLKPDIVAIQEFNYGGNAPADFRSMVDTAFGTNFVYYREPISGIPNGIISRYPILTNSSWTDDEQSQPNRGFAWAKIQLPGTNILYVVSVHLLTSGNRAAEAAAIKAHIQSEFPPDAWVIVAGDFNADSRTESAMTTFKTFLSDSPIPQDNTGTNFNTNMNRNHPYDYVLPSFSFTNRGTATLLPSHSFPSGLVFDSSIYTPLSDVAPVQAGDSHQGQHMAVMKDFLIPSDSLAPFISSQPQSISVVQGSNATFTVTAAGANPLAYQWRFGGTNIPGAMTNFYTLNAAQPANAGNYSVLITNSLGSVTSAVAVLTVVTAPVILTNPAPLSVLQGGTASFSLSAIGVQPLAYQWRLNGTNLSGATTNPFTLGNAQLSHAGNYSVLVTNSFGSVTSSPAALSVIFAATGSVVTLAGWDMSGVTVNYGPSPMAPTTNQPVVAVGGLTRGSGVGTLNMAAARTWGGNNFNSSSVANATNAGQFATFSITANAGYMVSFTSLSQYDYKRSMSGPPNGVLQYRVGSGPYQNITTFSYTSTTGASLGPVDLSGIIALQNVGPANTVTFRFVNYGASASGGNWYIYDAGTSSAPDLAVQGIITAVPPPSAAVISVPSLNGAQVGFNITGTAGANYVIQAATNLDAASWANVYTNASPFSFSDTNSGAAQKFYRAVAP